MEITKEQNGSQLLIALKGRLDTSTAPKLDDELGANLEGITDLRFDFKELEYLSSAGLRSLLGAQKIMNKQGSMVISNVNDIIMDVFEMTGFVDILTVE